MEFVNQFFVRHSRRLQLVVYAAACLLSVQLAAQPMPVRQIKFAIQGVEGSPQFDAALHFAQTVNTLSVGQLEVQVFGGGRLGSDLGVISAVRGGTIDITVLNTGLLGGVVRQMGVLDLPLVFANETEAAAVVDGPFGQKLHRLLEAKGMIGLTYWGIGMRHFHTGKKPLTRVDDLKGMKIRVTESPVYLDFIKALGAVPVPLAFSEVYGALEQTAVDGGTQQLVTMVSSKLYEVQRHIWLTGHVANPQSIIFSKKTWSTLSESHKDALLNAAEKSREYARRMETKRLFESEQFLKDQGMQFVQITEDERNRLRGRADQVIKKHSSLIGESWVQEMMEAIDHARTDK